MPVHVAIPAIDVAQPTVITGCDLGLLGSLHIYAVLVAALGFAGTLLGGVLSSL